MNKKLPELLEQYEDIVILWSLRVLYDLKGYMKMDTEFGLYGHDRALSVVGLNHLIDKYDEENPISKKKFRKILKEQSELYEAKTISNEGVLFRNIEELGKLVELSETEKKLLVFGTLIHAIKDLSEVCGVLGDLTARGVVNSLSIILDIDPATIRQALSKDGLLNKTGLLRLDCNYPDDLDDQLELLDDITDVLLDDVELDIMKSLRRFFKVGRDAILKPEDFAHAAKDYGLVANYLKSASTKRLKAVNILIYGPPGTGKTEMVRTLAKDIGCPLYEVNNTGEGETDEYDKARVDSYQLSQQVLKRTPDTLILFDEIEDVFLRDGSMERFGIRTSSDTKKGWFNQLLEENTLPAIWVSNVINHIDEAIIRRFDYVMELKTPPRKTRVRIFREYAKGLDVSEKWLQKIATNEYLAPGLISRAVKVVQELGLTTQKEVETHLERVVSNTLGAMGYDKDLTKGVTPPITYQLDVLNPDYDLVALQEALKLQPKGRICLYGQPGTGKTEYARYIADELDIPLITKRASDLLDPYIGMTERHISEMFEQAQEEEAVLLLDEADSFLQDRTKARESWQVTQVNELLTQMEQFDGLFFCSTNLMEQLDQASLRRFDLKIKFDFIKPKQLWRLFKQVLNDYEAKPAEESTWKKRVMSLQGLTPGDFATVARQSRFSGKPLCADSLFDGLERELKFKAYGAYKNMGFIKHS
ncbi:AAA family ATPase [Leucothrix sargassi]|nr:AAA family ATPase [Leucothrix sargassi]